MDGGSSTGPADFAGIGLSEPVLKGVTGVGFTAPRPIQAAALPPALAGRDVLGLARTGTGKTAAFVLPILERLARAEEARGELPMALILAPTRELVLQIAEAAGALGAPLAPRVVALIGGSGKGEQDARLADGADIVVATTGRLLDHLRAGSLDLGKVEVLVLDEADRMVDLGFLPDVRQILRTLPEGHQSMMFSATMPLEVQALAQNTLREPEILDLGGGLPAETIDHAAVLVRSSAKTKLLQRLLERPATRSAIVFVRTKQRAKAVSFALEKKGFDVALLHGDKKQRSRTAALESFRSGERLILVATDLASRGLDVEGVSLVINYDVPTEPDSYVHRIGRTGRSEREGLALTFVSKGDLADLRAIEHRIGARIERRLIEGFAALEDEDLME